MKLVHRKEKRAPPLTLGGHLFTLYGFVDYHVHGKTEDTKKRDLVHMRSLQLYCKSGYREA